MKVTHEIRVRKVRVGSVTKAISELAGEDYETDILSVDFSPENYSYLSDSCEIKIQMRRSRNSLLDSSNREQTDHQLSEA